MLVPEMFNNKKKLTLSRLDVDFDSPLLSLDVILADLVDVVLTRAA